MHGCFAATLSLQLFLPGRTLAHNVTAIIAEATPGARLGPAFHQTFWFQALCGFAALAALFAVHRSKVRRLESRQRNLEAENRLLEIRVAECAGELAAANEALRTEVMERARAEQQMQIALGEQSQSLSLLNATIEATPDGIIAFDLAGQVIYQNSKILTLWGIPTEVAEPKTQTQIDRWMAQQTSDPQAYLKEIEERNARLEEETFDVILLKDGRMLERYLRPQRVGDRCTGRVALYRDITERKRAEAELACERELLRTLLDYSPDCIFFKDLEGRLLNASRSEAQNLFSIALSRYRAEHPSVSDDALPPHLSNLEQFHRYTIGKSDRDNYGSDAAAGFEEDEREIIRTGKPIVGRIEKTVFPDGRTIWRMTTKAPWRDKHGKLVGTFGTSRDISDLKEAEAKADEAQKRLLDLSRQAGMAEVATGVLHNVGNVLNSINISSSVLHDRIRQSRTVYVARVADLLKAHADDLGGFMTRDPKGSQLPSYLVQLADHLAQEQVDALKELADLQRNIEHVKEIVAMQQNYARVAGVTQRVPVTELVEDALRLNEGSLTRHSVSILRDFQPDAPEIIVDKHKVMQILINLIRNGKYACDDGHRPDKQLVARIAHTPDRVRISITDNGVGIPRENLLRIFNHGFTTRKNGHGFGLHSGALAAKQMGGELLAHSEGPDHGATFTLELPLKPQQESS